MIVDPLETVIRHLANDADVRLVVGDRIAAKHRYGEGWTAPATAIVLRLDGGRPDIDTDRQVVRIEARFYGASPNVAIGAYRAMIAYTRQTSRATADLSNGRGLLYFINATSGPSLQYDPDVRLDFALCFFEAAVAESPVAA